MDIENIEEFKKCIKLLDSEDLESRLLGINLLRTCVNCSNLKLKVIYKHFNGETSLIGPVPFENLFICIEANNYGWKDYNSYVKWSDYIYSLFTDGYFTFHPNIIQHILINL